MEKSLIAALMEMGAPWIMNGILLWLLIVEKRFRDTLVLKLYEIGVEVARANTHTHDLLSQIEKNVGSTEAKRSA